VRKIEKNTMDILGCYYFFYSFCLQTKRREFCSYRSTSGPKAGCGRIAVVTRRAFGIETLLDAIILTNPRGYISDDFDAKIREAKSEITKKNLESAFDLIRDARLLLISQENEPEKTDDTEPEPVAEAVKTLILDAKDKFQEGKALQGVTSILDSLLLFKP